jgi:membrane protein YdbS with pleckstrin-like domain
VYRGVWRVLADLFRVPKEPPKLPTAPGERVESFRPAPQFLRLLKLLFWIWLALIDVGIFLVWLAIAIEEPRAGALLAVPALLLAIVPDVIAYVAIHLRYDTTWYVMSDRSLRCRRGIWIITEHTITFENVQNVAVRSGPLERLFGLATLIVETAGSDGGHEGKVSIGNRAIVEGITNADALRVKVMAQVEKSRGAGLGDDRGAEAPRAASAWSAEHVAVLREVRDALVTRTVSDT